MGTDLLKAGAALALLAASGCVVIVDDVSTTTTSETRETGDGDGDTTGESDVTTDTDTTTDTGDGDGDSGDGDGDPATTGDGDGDPTGDGDCDPIEDLLQLNYELSGVDIFNDQVEWPCTLSALDQQDGLTLELDCPEAGQPVILSVQSQPELPALNLEPGVAIDLRQVYEGPFWINLYLRLDIAGEHLLTLIDGDSLVPEDPFSFELPWPTAVSKGLCTPVEDFCAVNERLALDFTLDGQDDRVFDDNHAVIGPPPGHDVWIHEASELTEVDCSDTPPNWFRVLMVSSGNE